MLIRFFKNSAVLFGLAVASLVVTSTAMAQDINTSRGRTNGVTIEYQNTSYRALRKIRSLMDEGNYNSAANRAITYIKGQETNNRHGVEKSPYYREAYIALCASSTALRKADYALDACNKSLNITPDSWESLKSRATVHFMQENYASALADFNAALEHSPNDEVSQVLRQNIGVVRSKLN